MKKKKNNNNSNNNITTILLSVIIAILVIILIIVLVKDNNQENLNTNNTPNYNEPTNENNNESNEKYITKDKALEIALKHAKLNQNDVYDISIELEYKYKSNVYEVDFNHKYYDYEYYVDAVTGEILRSFKEID